MTNFLIAVAVNLVGMLLIYSLMGLAFARLSWRHHGMTAALVAIVLAGQFWLIPASFFLGTDSNGTSASYSIWFSDWLVTAFSIVLFCQAIGRIPPQLGDTVRLDGCGRLGVYWHVVLPSVWRELGLSAFISIMATLLLYGDAFGTPEGGRFFPPLFSLVPGSSYAAKTGFNGIIVMMVISLVMTLPAIGIFFFARGYLQRANVVDRIGSVSSTR